MVPAVNLTFLALLLGSACVSCIALQCTLHYCLHCLCQKRLTLSLPADIPAGHAIAGGLQPPCTHIVQQQERDMLVPWIALSLTA
jgi:hypothetical protein